MFINKAIRSFYSLGNNRFPGFIKVIQDMLPAGVKEDVKRFLAER